MVVLLVADGALVAMLLLQPRRLADGPRILLLRLEEVNGSLAVVALADGEHNRANVYTTQLEGGEYKRMMDGTAF